MAVTMASIVFVVTCTLGVTVLTVVGMPLEQTTLPSHTLWSGPPRHHLDTVHRAEMVTLPIVFAVPNVLAHAEGFTLHGKLQEHAEGFSVQLANSHGVILESANRAEPQGFDSPLSQYVGQQVRVKGWAKSGASPASDGEYTSDRMQALLIIVEGQHVLGQRRGRRADKIVNPSGHKGIKIYATSKNGDDIHCYRVVVGTSVDQMEQINKSGKKCTEADFASTYSLGTLASETSETQSFTNGSPKWCPGGKTRSAKISVYARSGSTESTAQIVEPTACYYVFNIFVPPSLVATTTTAAPTTTALPTTTLADKMLRCGKATDAGYDACVSKTNTLHAELHKLAKVVEGSPASGRFTKFLDEASFKCCVSFTVGSQTYAYFHGTSRANAKVEQSQVVHLPSADSSSLHKLCDDDWKPNGCRNNL